MDLSNIWQNVDLGGEIFSHLESYWLLSLGQAVKETYQITNI